MTNCGSDQTFFFTIMELESGITIIERILFDLFVICEILLIGSLERSNFDSFCGSPTIGRASSSTNDRPHSSQRSSSQNIVNSLCVPFDDGRLYFEIESDPSSISTELLQLDWKKTENIMTTLIVFKRLYF